VLGQCRRLAPEQRQAFEPPSGETVVAGAVAVGVAGAAFLLLGRDKKEADRRARASREARIRAARTPGARDLGPSPSPEEIHPSEAGVCWGRTPQVYRPRRVNWAYVG
jgi:hypothetical protein